MRLSKEEQQALVRKIELINIKVNQDFDNKFKQNIEKKLIDLEKKQDKHNNLIERMVVVEQSVKSAHHRIDDINEGSHYE